MDTTTVIVNQLTEGQQAILLLIPVIGWIVAMIIGALKLITQNTWVSVPPKTIAAVLGLIISVVISLWLEPSMVPAERIIFLVPQFFGTTGVAVASFEVKKTWDRRRGKST